MRANSLFLFFSFRREGKQYVNESMAYESTSSYFVKLIAPRVAIGINAAGHLMILEMDGFVFFFLHFFGYSFCQNF